MNDNIASHTTNDQQVRVRVNGQEVFVPPGTTVAVAVARSGGVVFHRSVTGHGRGPVCGMGICGECRVTVDGQPHCRACLIVCRESMEVETDA